MSEWQPIETAPKDGTWVLIYIPERGDDLPFDTRHYCTVAQWDDMSEIWRSNAQWENDMGNYATHWMPLPEPPNA